MLDARQIITVSIISTLLLGCSNNSVSTNTIADNIKADSSSTIVSADSSISNEKNIPVDDSIVSQIKQQTNWDRAEYGSLEIDTLVKLNENDFYLIYNILDGVSSTKYLMTFRQNKYKDYEVLEFQPDAELSYSTYECSRLRQSKNNTFKKVLFVDAPVDKTKIGDNGWFKEGYTQENVEMKTDSTTVLLTINKDAIIKRDTIKHSH
jgi:hypothetical protein